ncbi:hypothetical protein [Deinococcus peraridilitoris]|uniref:Uncharacterized protein n=1 Tax=Deinococcus peraridilitoris (strain DSM 19664 / LMG 22246 / CIP 109416 / KR-200) TaxID=937777 RepID=K9ZZC1_DEIPD|nr:hypothetical protein [Deinococcus peraridilitoris]AFZ66993.1 hypothetical protein Deipe_1452 [Deinococcus peraridilitoris DSM 19664]
MREFTDYIMVLPEAKDEHGVGLGVPDSSGFEACAPALGGGEAVDAQGNKTFVCRVRQTADKPVPPESFGTSRANFKAKHLKKWQVHKMEPRTVKVKQDDGTLVDETITPTVAVFL